MRSLDPASVNPAAINLYGHGGDALPIDNAEPCPLDLVPVPIEMVTTAMANSMGRTTSFSGRRLRGMVHQ